MKHVKFQPWIGKNYQSGFNGLRTLVLGESHYRSSDNLETINNIRMQVDGDWSYAFYTKTAKALIGRHPTIEDKVQFWNSVAFYNYVQESAGVGPRVSPSEKSWEISKVPFMEVLSDLKPNFIVSLGDRLWERLPDLDGREGPKIQNAPRTRTWIYPHSGGCALLYSIKHPSSAFSPLEWNEHILTALEKAKGLNGGDGGRATAALHKPK